MDKEKLQALIEDKDIIINEIIIHSKASEQYVDVLFLDNITKFRWSGYVPYYYRRTGLFIENESDLANYLVSIKQYFTKSLEL